MNPFRPQALVDGRVLGVRCLVSEVPLYRVTSFMSPTP